MQISDSGLIKEAINGNLSSFNTLIQKYEKYVYKIAFGFGRSADNALDISQNVFVKVFQKLSTFKGQSSFKSWIGRISYNEGVNWVRANKYIHKQDAFDEKNPALLSVTNEDEYLARENKSQLIKSLFTLNTRHRLAVVLRYFEDMPIKEIALTLDCSEGVVKNMLFRSLRNLRHNLQENKNSE